MKQALFYLFYRLALPVLFVVAFPSWLLKMYRRGGFGTGLKERFGLFDLEASEEQKGGIYVHAVSVGEVMLAIKLIRCWQREEPTAYFVLVPTTSTGHAVARENAPEGVRVIYSPLDFRGILKSVFRRFEPRQIVLMESELWPNMLEVAEKMGIPVCIANARLSQRSQKRMAKVRSLMRMLLKKIDLLCAQNAGDAARWASVGMPEENICVTGSVKYDHASGQPTGMRRPDFQEILDAVNPQQAPIVMGVSTFAGEEQMVGEVLQEVCAGLGRPLFYAPVPRHAERREEVLADLRKIGYRAVLRSQVDASEQAAAEALIIDSTGELRDWTEFADLVIVGKSLLEHGVKGGQNPTEAIAAGVPVITGAGMGNFEPLISELWQAGGVIKVNGKAELAESVYQRFAADGEAKVRKQVEQAKQVLANHEGAVLRTVAVLREHC